MKIISHWGGDLRSVSVRKLFFILKKIILFYFIQQMSITSVLNLKSMIQSEPSNRVYDLKNFFNLGKNKNLYIGERNFRTINLVGNLKTREKGAMRASPPCMYASTFHHISRSDATTKPRD